ncbi:hypothetical protein QTI24_29725 [Variovorax sp. J22P240]|uniref:hypothetical protein n=1 Tax=Variovorax sp. J22P240 TaxID=3053514 RepID=UPI00257775DD|nr:hypothetical protein [Variovorax sp. J22P240]MDM0002803.1 hypothetical protein [Variovorax sp. J22P240]
MALDRDARSCFVIMPFHEKPDPKRKDLIDFDRVYRDIIRPAVQGLAERHLYIDCVRCDEVERAGLIHERMLEYIADADIAVVDITTANPNVFYELGVRHALRDRVTVLIRRKGTDNPFNIGGMTTIEYDLDDPSAQQARDAIANFVSNGLLSGAKDSLVYSVLPGLKAGRESKAITNSGMQDYAVPHAEGKRIGIVCGDLRDVNLGADLVDRPIDIWVSSENIGMQMARPHDPSISGLIRYLGSRRDDTGTVLEDTIADELKKKMDGRQLVNPGEVVSTSAGELARTHKVKRLFHAASVYGVVGTGFHSIAAVERCITNALARADLEARGWVDQAGSPAAAELLGHVTAVPVPSPSDIAPPPVSILFPLLGAGTARADLVRSARLQVGAAVAYLRSRAPITCVERVYFLAANESVLNALRVTFAELGIRDRPPAAGGTKAPAKRAPATKAPRKPAAKRSRRTR